MKSEFAALAVDASFEHLAEVASYAPRDGSLPREVLVLPVQGDQQVSPFGVALNSEAAVFRLRAVDVDHPQEGDALIIDGVRHVINAVPERPDPLRLVWTVEAPAVTGEDE